MTLYPTNSYIRSLEYYAKYFYVFLKFMRKLTKENWNNFENIFIENLKLNIMYKKDDMVYNRLNKFVGTWNTEAVISPSENNLEIKIQGTDSYEWIMDGFFLLHTADVIIGTENSKTHEVIGYDKSNDNYKMQYFNNKGDSGLMIATYDNGLWTFNGDNLRFKGGFNEKENVFSGIWEQCIESKFWTHLMDIELSKKHSE